MAYKDEYEVARLYTDGSFRDQVASTFEGDSALRISSRAAAAGAARPHDRLPRKMSFGPWMMPAFRVLAKFKFLRGTAFDPFGRSPERRNERKLIADYEAMLDELLAGLTPDNHHLAVGLAAIPEKIRGFGHVKQRHLAAAKADERRCWISSAPAAGAAQSRRVTCGRLLAVTVQNSPASAADLLAMLLAGRMLTRNSSARKSLQNRWASPRQARSSAGVCVCAASGV